MNAASAAFLSLVETEANQFNGFKLAFTAFHFDGFTAAQLGWS